MSEELIQRRLLDKPEKIGRWDFYNIGSTTVKALKENGIIRNVDYGPEENKKVDGLIVHGKAVIAVIEFKRPVDFRTKAQRKKAVLQELNVAKKLGSKILIVTDRKDTLWINALTGNPILDENGVALSLDFDSTSDELPKLIEKINYSISATSNQLRPKELVNPTDLAKQIWQDIWSVSGATPENCLYTFIELFTFKYLSDLGVLKGIHSFQNLIDSFENNSQEEILENYANLIRPKIKSLFPESSIDKTTIINGTIFVSKDQKAVKGYSTVFKKVLLKFRDYGKLENIEHDFKSKLFESFLKESISKKNWGQFFTPLRVVRAIVAMAEDEIREGASICDPACGVGKFLLEPIKDKIDRFFKLERGNIRPTIEIHGFDKGFDRDEQKTIILAKANMLIYMSDLIKDNSSITEKFSELFNKCFILKTNSILGTLSDPVENRYDLILTNPPYVTSGSSNLKEEIRKDGELVNYYKINALGVEGLFMEWIVRALKPGGKAYVVVPDGILNRQNDKTLRKFILDECFIDAIISLPLKTFFTTPKKTYILCLTKKQDKRVSQTAPVFTYLVSEIGESRDVYRFDIDQNDLQEAVALYLSFKGNKDGFRSLNTDPRCKIQEISEFEPERHWSVDRWWTKDEKVALGILDEEQVIDLASFSGLIQDVADNLKEYSSMIIDATEKKNLNDSFKEISLSDKQYFELFIGKRLLKRDLVNSLGDIPAYSANVNFPVGFVSTSNIKKFDRDFVLWGIDGDFDFNVKRKEEIFATTDHCGGIKILVDDLLPEYLMMELDTGKYRYGFDRGLRASLKNMEAVTISIPLQENGEFDVGRQQELIETYQLITEFREKVETQRETINTVHVEIGRDQTFVEKPLGEILDFPPCNSKITRRFCIANTGDIPVYASAKSDTAVLGHIQDKIKGVYYYSNCLSWNRNGSVGYVFLRNHRFATNEDHRAMQPKPQFVDTLYLPYLKQEIELRLFENGFSFVDKCGVDKIKRVVIRLPLDDEGKFDIATQEKIGVQYEQLDETRATVSGELERLVNPVVKFYDATPVQPSLA